MNFLALQLVVYKELLPRADEQTSYGRLVPLIRAERALTQMDDGDESDAKEGAIIPENTTEPENKEMREDVEYPREDEGRKPPENITPSVAAGVAGIDELKSELAALCR